MRIKTRGRRRNGNMRDLAMRSNRVQVLNVRLVVGWLKGWLVVSKQHPRLWVHEQVTERGRQRASPHECRSSTPPARPLAPLDFACRPPVRCA